MTTTAAAPLIGVINAGSSSLKFSFTRANGVSSAAKRRVLGHVLRSVRADPMAQRLLLEI
jgi:hypothetical protein